MNPTELLMAAKCHIRFLHVHCRGLRNAGFGTDMGHFRFAILYVMRTNSSVKIGCALIPDDIINKNKRSTRDGNAL